MPLAPPPDGAVYPTWDACIRAVQTHAATEGYAVNSKGQAKSKETGLYRRYVIRCDKSGLFKSSATMGTRRVSSKKTDCPFSAACNIRPDGCFLRVLKPEHNHPPSASAGAHTQHRKLTEQQRHLLELRATERVTIKTIWEELKSIDPSSLITFKDVDNAVQRFRKKAKDGATGVQAIMYKLVERQDLHCFTLERDGMLQGAFWVPRWSTDLWMRRNGTPDILVMMSENIANRPVLPILEMNSLLNAAGFGVAHPNRAMPDDPALRVSNNMNNNMSNIDPSLTASEPPAPDGNGDNDESPATGSAPPNAMPPPTGMPDQDGRNIGLEASLGAGYAILPDKTNPTILWLRSSVEMLRARIPHCPKPRFLTLTDFHSSEKNILVEVSKGGTAHRQMHLVFGRVLSGEDEVVGHHGVRTRNPRRERPIRSDADTTMEPDGSGEDDEEEDGDGQEDGDGEQDDEGDDGNEDDDMDGDHDDSDAEIARQLSSANAHSDQNPYTNNPNQNPGHAYHQMHPQQHALSHGQHRNPAANPASMGGGSRVTLPPPVPRQPAMQAQPPAQMGYNMLQRLPENMMPRHPQQQQQQQHQHRPM